MRFSKARILAELPTEAITDKDLDLVDAIVSRLQMADGKIGTTVGDPYMGKQMAMRLSPTQLWVPNTAEQAARYGIRTVPGELDNLANGDLRPSRLMGVDFGWVDEGDALGSISYAEPKTKAGMKFARSQKFPMQLQGVLDELLAKAGMGPGDVLYNNPIGTLTGDYRRAKTYLKYGFGAPSADNEQFGQLDAMGRIVPIQPWNADQGLVRDLGWNPQPSLSMANAPA